MVGEWLTGFERKIWTQVISILAKMKRRKTTPRMVEMETNRGDIDANASIYDLPLMKLTGTKVLFCVPQLVLCVIPSTLQQAAEPEKPTSPLCGTCVLSRLMCGLGWNGRYL